MNKTYISLGFTFCKELDFLKQMYFLCCWFHSTLASSLLLAELAMYVAVSEFSTAEGWLGEACKGKRPFCAPGEVCLVTEKTEEHQKCSHI